MKQKFALATCLALIACNSPAQVLISAHPGNSYSETFDALLNSGTANTWTDNSTLPGWYASKTLGGATVATYRAGTGSDNAGALYSYGAASTTERALGSLGSGTPGNFAFGVRIQNDTGDTLNNILVSYTGEQWRNGGNNTAQTLYFSYRTSGTPITSSDALTNATWTTFPSLDFVTPIVGTTAAALDGNSAGNRATFANVLLEGVSVGPGEELFLRWNDLNDAGNDHGLAIDDLTVSFSRTFVPPVAPSITLPPQDTSANVHSSTSLSVAAAGTPPLHYQWYKDGFPLSNNENISGSTNSSLNFASVLHSNAGSYTVVVTNTTGSVTSSPALLTIVGFAITPIAPTNTLSGTPISISIGFLDNQSPITDVMVSSGNQNLITDQNISIVGSGNNRTVTFVPTPGISGVAIITLTATDGAFSTNVVFPIMVRPNTGVLLNDAFDYADGSLITNSAFLWQNHNNTVGDMQVISGLLYLSRSATEDVNALLIGQPYTTNGGASLYSKFTVNFNASDTPTSTGSYLAHFKDDAFGFRARVWVSTNATGQIRIGIGNSSDADKNSGEFPLDLSQNTTYTVVTRLNLSNNISTLWIDPTSESDPSVTATDIVTNLVGVSSYAFRQNSGMSKLFVDDLVVGTSFAAVTGGAVTPNPVPLHFQQVGNNLVLTWSDPAFQLQAGPLASGAYTNIPGATSPHTNAITGSQQFFRLISN